MSEPNLLDVLQAQEKRRGWSQFLWAIVASTGAGVAGGMWQHSVAFGVMVALALYVLWRPVS